MLEQNEVKITAGNPKPIQNYSYAILKIFGMGHKVVKVHCPKKHIWILDELKKDYERIGIIETKREHYKIASPNMENSFFEIETNWVLSHFSANKLDIFLKQNFL